MFDGRAHCGRNEARLMTGWIPRANVCVCRDSGGFALAMRCS